MNTQPFKDFVEPTFTFSESEWRIILSFFEEKNFKKNEMILKAGDVCNYIYFLNKGILRYFITRNKIEKTKYFTFPKFLFTAHHSFTYRIPTTENIQALTKTETIRIRYEDVESVNRIIPNFQVYAKLHIQHVQQLTEGLLLDTQMFTAEERYEQMLKNRPQIINQIPLKHLASFLGIKPESLSRIRKKLMYVK